MLKITFFQNEAGLFNEIPITNFDTNYYFCQVDESKIAEVNSLDDIVTDFEIESIESVERVESVESIGNKN